MRENTSFGFDFMKNPPFGGGQKVLESYNKKRPLEAYGVKIVFIVKFPVYQGMTFFWCIWGVLVGARSEKNMVLILCR